MNYCLQWRYYYDCVHKTLSITVGISRDIFMVWPSIYSAITVKVRKLAAARIEHVAVTLAVDGVRAA